MLVSLVGMPLQAASARIKKVLVFYLDQQGRQSFSPSLYERDAYQARLRSNPQERFGLRFDVHWNAPASREMKLRVEMRGAAGLEPTSATVELPVRKRGLFSRWTRLTVPEADYKRLGNLVAWRATLWDGDVLAAEQRSFLW